MALRLAKCLTSCLLVMAVLAAPALAGWEDDRVEQIEHDCEVVLLSRVMERTVEGREAVRARAVSDHIEPRCCCGLSPTARRGAKRDVVHRARPATTRRAGHHTPVGQPWRDGRFWPDAASLVLEYALHVHRPKC